jgi:long-subunit acyl-CoA synthetase (AMP-forming)
VLVFSENNIFYPIVFMGIIMAGGIFTGTNPTYLKTELAHQLRDSEAKLMFCNETQLETGLVAAETVGMAHDRIFIFDAEALGDKHNNGPTLAHSCKNWTSLLVSIDEAPMFEWDEFDTLDDNRTICLNYSSGTTGVPKGVEISHYNYVANCTQFIHQIQLDPDELQQRSRDRQICFLPLYHAMAQTIFLAVRPKRRVPVWIMRKYTLPSLLQNIERFRINDLLLVPPVLVAIAKSPITRTYDLTSVERVMCGAAPLGRETCEIFEQLWPAGQVNVKQGWGMTE